jgi:hypothetical protein
MRQLMILHYAPVAAILGLVAYLAVDYTRYRRGQPPLVVPWKWIRRAALLAVVGTIVAWCGAGLTAQHHYTAERTKVRAQAERSCQIDPEHGSVVACVAVRMGDWADSFPPPEWFAW